MNKNNWVDANYLILKGAKLLSTPRIITKNHINANLIEKSVAFFSFQLFWACTSNSWSIQRKPPPFSSILLSLSATLHQSLVLHWLIHSWENSGPSSTLALCMSLVSSSWPLELLATGLKAIKALKECQQRESKLDFLMINLLEV